MNHIRYIALILFLALCFNLRADIEHPVTWKSSVSMTDATHGIATLKATIADGYHVYAPSNPADGGTPLAVTWNATGARFTGEMKSDRKPHAENDEVMKMTLQWWDGGVTLTRPFEATQPNFTINGSVTYQACSSNSCLRPETEDFSVRGTAQMPAEEAAETSPDTVAQPVAADTVTAPVTQIPDLWAPVEVAEAQGSQQGGSSLWWIFFTCFLGGLLALLTPCVWPMIPLTVSFFLKKNATRAQSLRQAVTYGLAIIIIYLLLGLLVTAIFGASALNALATNAVCNIIFFLLLVLFAVSFFGAFEIKLPGSWSNKLDARAERTTGLLSTFFMAATLVIVSFSCTGPIIGTLLVEAASQGALLGPAVGMAGFAIALAIPFTLFALFPSLLKKMPKSGGWLNTVKVTLGFLELALSLKFLSVADLAYGWHILDRETFLALWIAIFGLLGLYLLGVFHFKSDGTPKPGIGVTRFMLALVSLAFTAYLVPGLWGAPLKATSAFVPPLSTQDFVLGDRSARVYDDYDEAMRVAAEEGKPVFVDFSGYGCVNCRKMEGAVLDDDEVKRLLEEEFVTVRLMVDDKTDLAKPFVVEENGKSLTLTTVGDKWSYLQRHKFGSNSQPYYVTLDAQGRLLSGPRAYDEDTEAFLNFLKQAIR